jgi:hypothetical protein
MTLTGAEFADGVDCQSMFVFSVLQWLQRIQRFSDSRH